MTTRIRVHVTPRAARDEVVAWHDGVLRVRVVAPPIDGKANAALERLLAKALGIARGDVRVSTGARGREKTVTVDGLDRAEVEARLR